MSGYGGARALRQRTHRKVGRSKKQLPLTRRAAFARELEGCLIGEGTAFATEARVGEMVIVGNQRRTVRACCLRVSSATPPTLTPTLGQIVEVSSSTMLRLDEGFAPQIREGSHRYALKSVALEADGSKG